jgi:hypothetical protein
VTTLKPDDRASAISQQIDNLSLSLVAPLSTDDYDALPHD